MSKSLGIIVVFALTLSALAPRVTTGKTRNASNAHGALLPVTLAEDESGFTLANDIVTTKVVNGVLYDYLQLEVDDAPDRGERGRPIRN